MAYLFCDACGKSGFRSKSGLAGHKKIVHGVDARKTVPDMLGRELVKLQKELAALSLMIGEVGEVTGELRNIAEKCAKGLDEMTELMKTLDLDKVKYSSRTKRKSA